MHAEGRGRGGGRDDSLTDILGVSAPALDDAVPGLDGQVAADALIGAFARHHRCKQPPDAELLERIGRVEGDALVNLVRVGAVPPADVPPVGLTLGFRVRSALPQRLGVAPPAERLTPMSLSAKTSDVPGAPIHERQGELSPEQLAAMRSTTDTFLAHLLRPTTHYRPDIDALRSSPTRIVVAVRATSQGQLAHRSAVALADRLGNPAVEFAGGHGGFVTLPDQCAQLLDQVLTQPT